MASYSSSSREPVDQAGRPQCYVVGPSRTAPKKILKSFSRACRCAARCSVLGDLGHGAPSPAVQDSRSGLEVWTQGLDSRSGVWTRGLDLLGLVCPKPKAQSPPSTENVQFQLVLVVPVVGFVVGNFVEFTVLNLQNLIQNFCQHVFCIRLD